MKQQDLSTLVSAQPSRRTLLAGAALAIAGVRPVMAQNAVLPLVVPYSPGGLTDGLGRLFAPHLKEILDTPVIVENRVGAGGSIGAAHVTKTTPGNLTLLLGSVGMATNPHLFKSLPYTPADLNASAQVALAPNVLYIHPSVPANNVKELVAYAKKNPGVLSFASSGIGSSPHLAAALFAAQADIDVVHVPYRGTGTALADFLGGQVKAYIDTMQSMKYAKEGRIRALAIATQRRIADAPGLPTIEEAGVPGVVSSSWFGFFVPASMPAADQERLSRALMTVAAKEEVKRKMVEMGVIPEITDQKAFSAFVHAESTKWGALIRKLNIVAT
jgi:tripartite-type tricarboxylate transporter receptor subunit TctC